MEIINHGKSVDFVFECVTCECRFQCGRDELDTYDGEPHMTAPLRIVSIVASCPNCGEPVESALRIGGRK